HAGEVTRWMAVRRRSATNGAETPGMIRRGTWLAPIVAVSAGGVAFGFGVSAADPPAGTSLRFEGTRAPRPRDKPADGRLLVVLGRGGGRGEPRERIGATGLNAAPLLGADVDRFAPGVVGVVDGSSEVFPIESLAKLPAGEYTAQAVF